MRTILALSYPFSHSKPPKDEVHLRISRNLGPDHWQPGHRCQERLPWQVPHNPGVFTGDSSEMETNSLAWRDGATCMQYYMTSFMAQFGLLSASAANFTNIPCPHDSLRGLTGPCSPKACPSADIVGKNTDSQPCVSEFECWLCCLSTFLFLGFLFC